jgi:glycosyltransferase involved in cell wall biosynthesis
MLNELTATIVNWRTPDLLEVALTGLLNCYPTLQVVIVENASGDASVDYVQEMVRTHPNISAILNQANPNHPTPPPPPEAMVGFYPGDRNVANAWASGNVGHGIGLHQVFLACRTPYLFTLDTDTIVHKCGFLEKMLAVFESNSNVYGVGWLINVHGKRNKSGVHRSIAMWDVEKYRTLYPFVLHGTAGLDNHLDALAHGYEEVDFPVGEYITHLWTGSRKRFRGIPHARGKPLRPELILWGIKSERIGGYWN